MKEISYNQAYQELKEILDEIKERSIDVDQLSAKVKRARELILICEKRIKKVELEVESIIKNKG